MGAIWGKSMVPPAAPSAAPGHLAAAHPPRSHHAFGIADQPPGAPAERDRPAAAPAALRSVAPRHAGRQAQAGRPAAVEPRPGARPEPVAQYGGGRTRAAGRGGLSGQPRRQRHLCERGPAGVGAAPATERRRPGRRPVAARPVAGRDFLRHGTRNPAVHTRRRRLQRVSGRVVAKAAEQALEDDLPPRCWTTVIRVDTRRCDAP